MGSIIRDMTGPVTSTEEQNDSTRNAMREMLCVDPLDTTPIKFNFTEIKLTDEN